MSSKKNKINNAKLASEYVQLFLESNNISKEIIESWKESENQKNFFITINPEIAVSEKEKIKKPMSSYNFFCKDDDIRNIIKLENPSINHKDIMVKLGELWKTQYIEPETRQKWDLLSKEEKKRYNEECNTKLNKSIDSSPKIRKPRNPYRFFFDEVYNEVKSKVHNSLVFTEISKLWEKLKSENPEEYLKYVRLADEDKERYNREKDSLKDEEKVLVDANKDNEIFAESKAEIEFHKDDDEEVIVKINKKEKTKKPKKAKS